MLGDGLPPTVDLPDGTVGYFVRYPRTDDCFAAAVATTLQVPIDEVPDPHLKRRCRAGELRPEINRSCWQEFDRWLAGRGQRKVVHRRVPVARARWIGVVLLPGWFNSHCMVMSRDEVLFDPVGDVLGGGSWSWLRSLSLVNPDVVSKVRTRVWGAEHIGVGLSFQRLSKANRGRRE